MDNLVILLLIINFCPGSMMLVYIFGTIPCFGLGAQITPHPAYFLILKGGFNPVGL